MNFSLIICIHNEEDHLPELIRSLSPGPDDEIIFVLDRCSDQSEMIIRSMSPHLNYRLIVLENNPWVNAPKKFAVKSGIENAQGDFLVFTDADCSLPHHYFDTIRPIVKEADIIIGYSIPQIKPMYFHQHLQLFDAWYTALKYTIFTQLGIPYMAVGRNWGFKRSIYTPSLFESHQHILSGDDDLVLQQLLKKGFKPVLIESLNVNTRIKPSLSTYITQKKRHHSAGVFYPIPILILLFLFACLGWPLLLTGIILTVFSSPLSGGFVMLISLTLMTAFHLKLVQLSKNIQVPFDYSLLWTLLMVVTSDLFLFLNSLSLTIYTKKW